MLRRPDRTRDDGMHSQRLTIFSVAALVLASSASHAADYSPKPLPQPIITKEPAPASFDCCEGWYLRGQVGIGMTSAAQLDFSPNAATAAANFGFDRSFVSDAYFLGGGVGYNWNSWLRFEGTAEYRAKSRLTATASYTVPAFALDTYDANLKSWVFLANAFVDLGTWNCFTPFIGAGIGAAWNQFSDFTDVGIPTGGRGFGRDTAKWDFAWALYAGVAYNVTKTFKMDFTYRYLNYGSFTDTIDCVGGCGASGPLTYHLEKVYSHDFMVGFRWECCDLPAPPPPPLRSKG